MLRPLHSAGHGLGWQEVEGSCTHAWGARGVLLPHRALRLLVGLGYKRAKLQLVVYVGMGVQTRRHLLCGNKQHLLWNSRLRPRGKKLDLLSGGLSIPELGRWSEVQGNAAVAAGMNVATITKPALALH